MLARRWLVSDGLRPLRRWRPPGRGVRLGGGLGLRRRRPGWAGFTATRSDPHLFLACDSLDAQRVVAVRFNIWWDGDGPADARLYWRGPDDDFAAERSMSVRLETHPPAWREYVVRLDDGGAHPAWRSAGRIVELRFHPPRGGGWIGLGEVALCGVE